VSRKLIEGAILTGLESRMREPVPEPHPKRAPWRDATFEIIFGVDTRAGRTFDVVLLCTIVASIIAVSLESVAGIRAEWGLTLRVLEWIFTIAFSAEYLLRLFCVKSPWRYARSFFGVVDLLAVLPTYLSLLLPGAQSLLVIRALRLLRVFRVLKLVRFSSESRMLVDALMASRAKIVVFLGMILSLSLILGTAVYWVEGSEAGFTSIPRALYWAIVTMTTVGYGDLAPQTVLGQAIAAAVMILGYSIIAVPTGIVGAEVTQRLRAASALLCPHCGLGDHRSGANHCWDCGGRLAAEGTRDEATRAEDP
jgi:voltage-gated potassium channel